MSAEALREMFQVAAPSGAALITYATGCYPDRKRSAEVVRAMLAAGADAVEIGVPFSDPVMDGPVIQKTSVAALSAGATVDSVLDLLREVRGGTARPLLIMTYYNPVFRYGLERFAHRAHSAGADGLVVPDLPVEEMGPLKAACDSAGLATVAFCAPTTSPQRLGAAAAATTGFLYCVSQLGTTGARESLPPGLPGFLARVREHASCPIAVGVGISTPEQCREAAAMADGVIVGSALMKAVAETDGSLEPLSRLVSEMSEATHRPRERENHQQSVRGSGGAPWNAFL